MPIVHIGSGQLSRRKESMGLRWCNGPLDKRNLFIHDGRVLFILAYHKSINITNASRWPVHFLLPEVGTLCVQYLVLIQPFRIWLNQTVKIPEDVAIDAQSWRQIAVGIAIKKFAGLNYPLFPSAKDGKGDHPNRAAGSMADVFHWQGSKSIATLATYGTDCVNILISPRCHCNHPLIQNRKTFSALLAMSARVVGPLNDPGRRRPAGGRTAVLWRGDASQRAPLRWCRQWTMDQAQAVLERMFGPVHNTGRQTREWPFNRSLMEQRR
ncbi:hypothetical protein VTN00DRAFT_2735 [Thermoascus crustaceus]|uniref:uncharacterized protein n=1 Tax=Thermoascus crustaceus TaxID=5088 RepID=UPI003744869D